MKTQRLITFSMIVIVLVLTCILVLSLNKSNNDSDSSIQWYPDKNGKFSARVKAEDVKMFVENMGSVVSNKPPKFDLEISKSKSCDDSEGRLLIADYLQRVYNGTNIDSILRLSLSQMESLLMGNEWIYTTPNLPTNIIKYFASKKRFVESDLPDCDMLNSEDCSSLSGGSCYKSNGKCVRSYPNNLNSQWGDSNSYAPYYATNTSYGPGQGTAPITTLVSNWSGDRNQARLFQTQMRSGKYWGNSMYTDPTRATVRRGMMNSPQNNSKFFDERFGYGGVPCNVLFEGGMLPIDSAFAPPGKIENSLGVPNSCNSSVHDTCVYPATKDGTPASNPDDIKYNKNKNVYTYYSPGSGMFFNSGICTYMFNYVDGLLNSPPEFYDPSRSGFNYTYDELLTTRLSNGLPDHVAGLSKIMLYLMSQVYWEPKAYNLAITAEKSGDWEAAAKSQYNLTAEEAKQRWTVMKSKGRTYLSEYEVKLPNDCLPALNRIEERYHKGGLGLPGRVNPFDGPGPPRGITSARSLVSQVAGLMGVWRDPMQAPSNSSSGEKYGYGLFTKDGNPKPAKCLFVDKRKYAMGWINGRWYGYPPEKSYSKSDNLNYMNSNYPGNNQDCSKKIGTSYMPFNSRNKSNGGLFTKGGVNGVPGKQVESSEKWKDGYFTPTKENPLVYYGFKDPKTGKREKLYETWYGKPITMDYVTATKLTAIMYSMGDTGWDESIVCWPFGSYFAYSMDLGPGKAIIGGMSLEKFNSTSLHYTMTPTSLSKSQLVSPAYDYEILLTIPDKGVQTFDCFCKNYMKSVDLLHDNGKHLHNYAAPGKGALGGWMPVEAGVAYDGSKGLSNYTHLYDSDEYNKDPDAINATGAISTGYGCVGSDGKVPDYKKDDCWFASFDQNKHNMVTGMSNKLKEPKCS